MLDIRKQEDTYNLGCGENQPWACLVHPCVAGVDPFAADAPILQTLRARQRNRNVTEMSVSAAVTSCCCSPCPGFLFSRWREYESRSQSLTLSGSSLSDLSLSSSDSDVRDGNELLVGRLSVTRPGRVPLASTAHSPCPSLAGLAGWSQPAPRA
jgi:hypothetical protein